MSKKKELLGKGIRALLADMDEDTETLKISVKDEDSIINTVPKIPLEQIEINPFQPRTDFDQQALQELSSSIKIHGVIQPITLRKIGERKYQLISGERRLRATHLAGIKEIPAYVRSANDQEVLEMALIENIQREDLNAMEVALTYKRLIDECELTHEALAERMGKDRSTVTNYLRLLKLPPEIQTALRDRTLSMGHARAIVNVAEVDKQLYVFKEVVKQSLSVRKTEDLVRLIANGSISTKSNNPNPEKQKEAALPVAFKNVEQKLMDVLETKVKIKKGTQDKGEIVIPFYSTADLNRLLDIIDK